MMTDLLTRLENWLKKHRKRYLRGLRPGATDAELGQLEKSVGKVPADLKQLLVWHNGQDDAFVGYLEEHWLFMGTIAIAQAKRELDADPPPGWRKTWLPFLDDDGGDYLCLDTAATPSPVQAFHLDTDQTAVAPALEAWLSTFVANLETGKYTEDPERGTLERGST